MSTAASEAASLESRVRAATRIDRLVDTARELIAIPSPTGDAGRVASRLAELLAADGFAVERHDGSHARAPAVVTRIDSGAPGPTLQFDGHIDTVHLPFVPPRIDDDRLLRGSGASDMKAGVAAAVEALRVLRELGLPRRGAVLFVAHDLHEAPWGHGEQLDALIRAGVVGDAVLIPEPLSSLLPVAGRGAAVWRATITRPGDPVHEVMRDPASPHVIAAASELMLAIEELDARLARHVHPIAGAESVFVGQMHGGEIYNQLPSRATLEGTRRWLPGAAASADGASAAESELRALCAGVAAKRGVAIDLSYRRIRGAFSLDEDTTLVRAFDAAFRTLSGRVLARGPKPFVDDGNSFSALAGIPAITHGPRAGGQHSVDEWVDIDDLGRVAMLYAVCAALFTDSAS